MDDINSRALVRFSQGVHLVINRNFVPGKYAVMIPKTKDGRVLFAVPWHNKVVVGTTDVQKEAAEIEPVALQEEIDFILETASRFLAKPPGRSDVLSVFAGLRPLAAPRKEGKNTKEISRGHIIRVSDSGMITITGGKWTTYRKMAQDVIDLIARKGELKISGSKTDCCRIHGYKEKIDRESPFYFYGSDEEKILALVKENKEFGKLISKELHIIKAQVVWSVRHEMARTVEDFLSRRTRALLLNARESLRIAPVVAELMATELNADNHWTEKQLADYAIVAKNYILQ
jgi:glycerol-3-phosphate dehydrogenase